MISSCMAELVVHPFEMIEVDEDHRQGDGQPDRKGPFSRQELDEEPAVREKNLRVLKEVLAGETGLFRDPKAMVPYSM
jgi:hypothetical protein